MNLELPDVQCGFRKGRRTRDQIVNIHWITKKAREFQKNIYFCSLTMLKLLAVCSESPSVMSDSLWPHGLYSPWNSPGQNTGVGDLYLLQGIFPTQGSEPRPHTLWVDSLPTEPPGKPKNTRVGSLSLLQGIFPAQELNQGLLHCRRILYQLSHQGSLDKLFSLSEPQCPCL